MRAMKVNEGGRLRNWTHLVIYKAGSSNRGVCSIRSCTKSHPGQIPQSVTRYGHYRGAAIRRIDDQG